VTQSRKQGKGKGAALGSNKNATFRLENPGHLMAFGSDELDLSLIRTESIGSIHDYSVKIQNAENVTDSFARTEQRINELGK
jgi:hypothetical protein